MAFWNRKTKEKLQALPLADAKLELHHTLKLASVRINYSVDSSNPYRAYITYMERPLGWNDNGASKQIELNAKSWPELIDKVAAHFEGEKQ